MFTTRTALPPLAFIALLGACGGHSRGNAEDTLPRLDSSAARTGSTTVGRATIDRPSASNPPAPSGKTSPTNVSVSPVVREPKPETMPLSRLMEAGDLIGKTVRVVGTCAGYGVAGAGPPPKSRSDWVLRAGDRLIYVVGAFPPACGPQGGEVEVSIIARVAEDTLPSFAGRSGQTRRYLISIRN